MIMQVKTARMSPTDEERRLLELGEDDNNDDKEEKEDENKKEEDKLQIQMLQNEITRLRKENQQKDDIISELKKRISELEGETIPNIGFEMETTCFERDFREREVLEKEVQICGVVAENEILLEKLEVAEEIQDDLATHLFTQPLNDKKEGEEEKKVEEEKKEEEENKEEEKKQDEEKEEEEGKKKEIEGKEKGKTKVDPSSLTKRVKEKQRADKKDSIYHYPSTKKKDDNKSNPENTKLGSYITADDMNYLRQVYQTNPKTEM